MARFIPIDSGGTARNITRFIAIDSGGTARTIQRAFVIDSGGTARLFYAGGTIPHPFNVTALGSESGSLPPEFGLNSDGTYYGSGLEWVAPASAASNFEVRVIHLTGPAMNMSSSPFNTWLPFNGSNYLWIGQVLLTDATCSIEFRRASTGTLVSSGTITFTVGP